MDKDKAIHCLNELAQASRELVRAVKELDKGNPAWYDVFLCRKSVEQILGISSVRDKKLPLSEALHKKLGTRVSLAFPYFAQYLPPAGFLSDDVACHALFYYAMLARKNWEEYVKNSPIEYDGELTQQVNFRNLFNSISELYGEPPEKMIRFWLDVDLTFDALRIPRLPDEERYRFNKPFEVINSK